MRGDSPELRARVAAALKEASREDWVPLHLADLDADGAAELAAYTVRRWLSFARRSRGPRPDRVDDLARGLRQHTTTGSTDEEPTYCWQFVELAKRAAVALEDEADG